MTILVSLITALSTEQNVAMTNNNKINNENGVTEKILLIEETDSNIQTDRSTVLITETVRDDASKI